MSTDIVRVIEEGDLPPFVQVESPFPTVTIESTAEPIGVDLKFDFAEGDVPAGSDVRVARGTDVVRQWIFSCLMTAVDTEIIYTPNFGSSLRDLQRNGMDQISAQAAIPSAITAALIVHDRIVSVEDITVKTWDVDNETTIIGFTVVMDDGTTIEFPEVALA